MNASSSKLRTFLLVALIIISVITMVAAGEGLLLLEAFGTGLALGFAFTTDPIFGIALLVALSSAGNEVRKAQAPPHVPVNVNWLDIVWGLGMSVAAWHQSSRVSSLG